MVQGYIQRKGLNASQGNDDPVMNVRMTRCTTVVPVAQVKTIAQSLNLR